MTKKATVVFDNGNEAVTKPKRVRINNITNTLHIFVILTESDKYVAFSKINGKVQHMVKFQLGGAMCEVVPEDGSNWLWNVAPKIGGGEGVAASYFTLNGGLVIKDVRYLVPIKRLVEWYISDTQDEIVLLENENPALPDK